MPHHPARACLDALEQLYKRLDDQLHPQQGNPCGRCRQCCTSQGLSFHNVTRLELDYLVERVGAEKMERFGSFLQRGGNQLCPYFDEQSWGCGVYPHRPFSCRTFGHYRASPTALPQLCVFSGQEKVFPADLYYQFVPQAAELRDLARRYWLYRADPLGAIGQPGPLAPVRSGPRDDTEASSEPSLERALGWLSQGLAEQALQEFESSDLPSTAYVLYCLSLVFEELRRHSDACTALGVALEQEPECALLWFRLACNQFALEDPVAAEQSFLKTLRLEPEHPLAHGMLGGLLLQKGRLSEALDHLRTACRLTPWQDGFARMLAAAEAAT
jgi:Fe-S-cluster containining protein